MHIGKPTSIQILITSKYINSLDNQRRRSSTLTWESSGMRIFHMCKNGKISGRRGCGTHFWYWCLVPLELKNITEALIHIFIKHIRTEYPDNGTKQQTTCKILLHLHFKSTFILGIWMPIPFLTAKCQWSNNSIITKRFSYKIKLCNTLGWECTVQKSFQILLRQLGYNNKVISLHACTIYVTPHLATTFC